MNTHATNIREAAVAGLFYPADSQALCNEVTGMLKRESTCDTTNYQNIRALVVPHAGYAYSGITAAKAFAALSPNSLFDAVFLLGNSHQKYFQGAALCNYSGFKTPLGTVEINTQVVSQLNNTGCFETDQAVHATEHSLEVLLPFMQVHLHEKFTIVPILLGTNNPEVCRTVAQHLVRWFTPRNLFVVSTDLSHYPDASTAIETDSQTVEFLIHGDARKLHNHLQEIKNGNNRNLLTGMCGEGAVLTLLEMIQQTAPLSLIPVHYSHSAMTAGENTNRVVGYQSLVVTQAPDQILSEHEKAVLINLARQSVSNHLMGTFAETNTEITPNLNRRCGAFVSVYVSGKLRGCIGQFAPETPLWQTVAQLATAAATTDKRFKPVTPSELHQLSVELSVLSPLRPIANAEEYDPLRHGIYIRKGNRCGTFLPQVAQSTGWNKWEMLSHCSQQKAGLGPDGWQQAELFVYEAVVFSDKTYV